MIDFLLTINFAIYNRLKKSIIDNFINQNFHKNLI
jgi:hypothetical protein